MHALFVSLTAQQKRAAIEDLIHDSTPRPSFFAMVILSVLMATFGLLINNGAVIIGSMLIAPILSPILSLAMGIVMNQHDLILRSGLTLLRAFGVGVVLAVLATLFAGQHTIVGDEIIARTQPTLIFFAIAVVAGLAAAFARINPDLSETLPGIAISVALIPPLAVIGIGIAHLSWSIVAGAAMLLVVNIVGIVFAAMLVFSLMDLYSNRADAVRAARREDRTLARQLAAAQRATAARRTGTAKH